MDSKILTAWNELRMGSSPWYLKNQRRFSLRFALSGHTSQLKQRGFSADLIKFGDMTYIPNNSVTYCDFCLGNHSEIVRT